MRRLVLLTTLALPLASAPPLPAQSLARDSAGVRIVQNRGVGTWRPQQTWRYAADLAIGKAEGDSAYLFGRVADVAVDSRLRILVLDQLTRRVRVYDRAGRFLFALGRSGQGPGELSQYLNSVLVTAGDTVLVPDHTQRRINVYSPAGAFVREISIAPRPGAQSWVLLGDRGFMFRGLSISRDAQGQFQTWDGLLSMRRDGTALDTLFAFDYERSLLGAPGSPRVPLIVNAAFWTRLDDGRIAWSSLDREELRIHAPDGRLQAIVRSADWRRKAIGMSDRNAMREMLRQKLTIMGGDAASVDRLDIIYGERFPAITALHTGPDHTLWVQLMDDVSSIDPMALNATDRSAWLGGSTWHVLDAQGILLGRVTLPDRFAIMRITSDAIYGVQKDDQDVDRVLRLKLIRGL